MTAFVSNVAAVPALLPFACPSCADRRCAEAGLTGVILGDFLASVPGFLLTRCLSSGLQWAVFQVQHPEQASDSGSVQRT